MERLLESNIDQLYELVTEEWDWDPDDAFPNYQRQRLTDNFPHKQWSQYELTVGLDNRSTVTCNDKGQVLTYWDRKVTDRSYDYILSVLESLLVGEKREPAWSTWNHGVKWHRPRTFNPINYPRGPNILIQMAQDKQYVEEDEDGIKYPCEVCDILADG